VLVITVIQWRNPNNKNEAGKGLKEKFELWNIDAKAFP
jgi:hypothetical protein